MMNGGAVNEELGMDRQLILTDNCEKILYCLIYFVLVDLTPESSALLPIHYLYLIKMGVFKAGDCTPFVCVSVCIFARPLLANVQSN